MIMREWSLTLGWSSLEEYSSWFPFLWLRSDFVKCWRIVNFRHFWNFIPYLDREQSPFLHQQYMAVCFFSNFFYFLFIYIQCLYLSPCFSLFMSTCSSFNVSQVALMLLPSSCSVNFIYSHVMLLNCIWFAFILFSFTVDIFLIFQCETNQF